VSATLIEIVQDILSAMDSDEVNSISDTTESLQVATIVKNAYNDILTEIELPTEYTLFKLDSSGNPAKPVQMSIPDNIDNIEWIKYNKVTVEDTTQQFKEIEFLPKENFLRMVHGFNSDDDNIASFNYTMDGVDFPILYRTDINPQYYTSFNDRDVVFDAILIDVDTTLQSTKTMCYGKKTSVFTMSDSFVPFTEDKYSSFLFNSAKALAFAELKQMTNAKAEKAERRARIKTQSSKRAVPYARPQYDYISGYGRRT